MQNGDSPRAFTASPSGSDRTRSRSAKSPRTRDASGQVSQKVSCLACRRAKRKCITKGMHEICRRCMNQNLECEYREHRRGRVKKVEAPNQLFNADVVLPPFEPPVAGPSSPPDQRIHASSAGISFSHVIPNGDSLPYRSPYGPDAESEAIASLLKNDTPDPVKAGLLSESEVPLLFDFYFRHLNITLPVLDPEIHTPHHVVESCPLLYTAIITVTSRIVRPGIYSTSLLLANKLVGQMVEYGLCSVELVQALIILAHWKKPDDATSWRRVGYAIRMGLELRLNMGSRGSQGEDPRRALNRERTWFNLLIADYHLAIHHSLPRMIVDDSPINPTEWAVEHSYATVPGELVLAPLVHWSRLCRLYADSLAAMTGNSAHLRVLGCIESEWIRWRRRWLTESRLAPQQLANLKTCDAYFRFHIAEYRLLDVAKFRPEGDVADFGISNDLSTSFTECTTAALGVSTVFREDVVSRGYLPFCFNLVWISLAVTSVWLVKNINSLRQIDRIKVIKSLTAVEQATQEASRSSDDMSAYTHRLMKHLLSSIPPEWRFSSLLERNELHIMDLPGQAMPNDRPDGTGAHQISIDDLWLGHVMTPAFDQPRMDSSSCTTGFTPIHTRLADSIDQGEMFPPNDDAIWRALFPSQEGVSLM